jgi:PAS domain S-box-containing protein
MHLEGGMPMQDTRKTKARLLEELRALRRSEAEYRAVVEQQAEFICRWLPDGRITFVNDAYCRYFGKRREELVGRSFMPLIPPEDQARVADYFASLTPDQPLATHEHRVMVPGGKIRWMQWTDRAIFDETGRLVEYQSVGRDVTERVLAEEALAVEHQQLLSIFDGIDEVVYVADPETYEVLYVNEACRRTVGDVVGQKCYRAFQGLDAPCPFCTNERIFGPNEGRPYVWEFQNRRNQRWYRCIDRAVRWPDGRMVRYEMAIDITEQRCAQEALRKSEGEKALILSSVAEQVLFQDTRHRIIWANRAAAESVGATPDQIVGRFCYTVWHPRTEPCIGCPVHKALETGEAGGVAEIQSEDGRCWLIKGYPIRDADGNVTGAVEVALDITEQRRAEEERRRLEARVRDAQKLESLGVLAGGIAHDFNNLLVGILGNAGLAHLEMPPDSPLRKYCDQIEQAALRARDLTNQLLAFSGKGKFQVRPANLSDLVRDTADLLRVSIPRHVTLDLHLAPDSPPILADATQIRQVVMNLLTNASEAVGDSPGTITLVTGSVHADRQYLAGAFVDEDLPEGDYVFLDVSDTGCGMDAETQARIFDPFFSTKFSGRGLGLAAVLGIVRGHRGAVRVYSEPGHGTAVKVLFPAADVAGQGTHEPAAPAEGAASISTEGFRGSGTVLVIDDEPSVRDVARAILEKAGFEVLVAASGREGLERFRACADRIVAVLLDMTMPDLAGEEVFAELRSIRPGVPVILSSGYNEQDATRRFAPSGLAGFIQKPYLPADLLSKVRAALRV